MDTEHLREFLVVLYAEKEKCLLKQKDAQKVYEEMKALTGHYKEVTRTLEVLFQYIVEISSD